MWRIVIFNGFVFCQIFNEVNARKLEDKNVFRGITTNRLFIGIVGTTVVLEIIIVECLKEFASTVKLPWKYWVISMVIVFISWPLALVAKFIPLPKNVVPLQSADKRRKEPLLISSMIIIFVTFDAINSCT